MDSIPGSGRFPGEGNGNPFHYYCRGSPIGQRSLGGYSPRGHKKLDTAGRACTHAAQSCLNHFQSLHEGVTSVDSAWAVTHRAWLWHHSANLAGRLLSDKELGFGIRQIRAWNLTIIYAPWHWANPLRIDFLRIDFLRTDFLRTDFLIYANEDPAVFPSGRWGINQGPVRNKRQFWNMIILGFIQKEFIQRAYYKVVGYSQLWLLQALRNWNSGEGRA